MKAELILEFDELDLYKFIDPDQYDLSSELFFVEKADADTLIGVFFSSNKRTNNQKYLVHFIDKNKQLCKTLYAKDFYSMLVYDQKSYILNKDLKIESELYTDSNRDSFVESMRNRISIIINKNENVKEKHKSIADLTQEIYPNYFLLCNDTNLSFIEKNNIYIYNFKNNEIKIYNGAIFDKNHLTSEISLNTVNFPTIIKDNLIYYKLDSYEFVFIDLKSNNVFNYSLKQLIANDKFYDSNILKYNIFINLYTYNEQLYLRIVDKYKSYIYKITILLF
jgi:hypothetical protein